MSSEPPALAGDDRRPRTLRGLFRPKVTNTKASAIKTEKSARAISKLVPAKPAIPTAAVRSDTKKNSDTHRKIEGMLYRPLQSSFSLRLQRIQQWEVPGGF
jgi:hypothetical protein